MLGRLEIKVNHFLAWQHFTQSVSILRPPYTTRFFVVGLLIFYRDQIGLKFVGPSACRTLDVLLPRLTTWMLALAPTHPKASWNKRLLT